jgi:hypothetical protein
MLPSRRCRSALCSMPASRECMRSAWRWEFIAVPFGTRFGLYSQTTRLLEKRVFWRTGSSGQSTGSNRSPGSLVSSYLTVSPLPLARRSVLCGAFHGSPRLGVTQHPALRSPDVPRALPPAVARPDPVPARGPVATICLSALASAPGPKPSCGLPGSSDGPSIECRSWDPRLKKDSWGPLRSRQESESRHSAVRKARRSFHGWAQSERARADNQSRARCARARAAHAVAPRGGRVLCPTLARGSPPSQLP